MCGICGFVKNNSFTDDDISKLDKMSNAIVHRGPDDFGSYVDDKVGLAFRRLSIIDLSSAGHQPMSSSDGSLTIVFNGEIYNYLELKSLLEKEGFVFNSKTDTEVILAAYQFWGSDCLGKFIGMWAFVIYDKPNRKIFASRDRFGIKPFYYYTTEDTFYFASEIPPILNIKETSNQENNDILFDYFLFNRQEHTDQTFFKEIYKLPKGHYCIFDVDNHKLVFHKWYDLKKKIKENDGSEFKAIFEDSLKIHLRSDVPIGVCLSGGIDSGVIVASLAQLEEVKEVYTFSAIYGENLNGDERYLIDLHTNSKLKKKFVKIDATDLQDNLLPFIKTHAEPVNSSSVFAQYMVMSQVHQSNVKVTLDGQGADEQLGGYKYFYSIYLKELIKEVKLMQLATELYYIVRNNLFSSLIYVPYFIVPERFRWFFVVNSKKKIYKDLVSKLDKKKYKMKSFYGDSSYKNALVHHLSSKIEHLLKWSDRNSMHFGIESRVPFLDHRLVEYSLGIPFTKVFKNGYSKWVLRSEFKEIMPSDIIKNRKKIGFETPEAVWFRNSEIKKYILEVIDSSRFKKRGLVDIQIAKALMKEHFEGSADHSREIWKWLNAELWFREFIDKYNEDKKNI